MMVLDVFIGLVLVYFLYSLLVSVVAELFATWIGMRARILRQGIDNFLNDKKPHKEGLIHWLHDLFLVEHESFRYSNAGKFYEEPTIKYLAKVGENKRWSIKNTKPAYIEKNHFISAIISMFLVRSIGINEWDKVKFAIDNNTLNLEPDTLKMFKDWMTQSNGNYEKFKALVGNSFEEVNDRLVGWYKRKIGVFLFVFGLLLAFTMNVDTFEIVQILANDPDTRQEMVELAIATSEKDPSIVTNPSTGDDPAKYEHVKKAYDNSLTSVNKVIAFSTPVGASVTIPFNHVTFFVSIADLGPITSFRLVNDTSEIANLYLKEILSPGVFASINFGDNYPVTINAGYQQFPLLEKVNEVENTVNVNRKGGFSGSIVVNVPLFTLYNQRKD